MFDCIKIELCVMIHENIFNCKTVIFCDLDCI